MMVEMNRRQWIAGLGAAIVALRSEAGVAPCAVDREIKFALRNHEGLWPLTQGGLISAVKDLGDQVAALGPLTRGERITAAAQVDAALDAIRPLTVRIVIRAPLDRIAKGDFVLREPDFEFGIVVIE